VLVSRLPTGRCAAAGQPPVEVLGSSHRRGRHPTHSALLVSTPIGAVPLNQVVRLAAGWDAAVFGGLLSMVLPDAAVLPTVMIAGLSYSGWVKARAVWAHRRRAPRYEMKPVQECAEQRRN
jgi:hypothetical protein